MKFCWIVEILPHMVTLLSTNRDALILNTSRLFKILLLGLKIRKERERENGVTRFGEVLPLKLSVKKFWLGLFCVWLNFSLFWQILMFENGQILNKQSSHLVTLSRGIREGKEGSRYRRCKSWCNCGNNLVQGQVKFNKRKEVKVTKDMGAVVGLNEGIVSWKYPLGGSPGLVVMGGDSCNEGRGFESQHWIMDVHFSHLLALKFVLSVWKDWQ